MASKSPGGIANPSEQVSEQVSGAIKKGRQSSSPDDGSDSQTDTQNSGKLHLTGKSNLSSEMCEHLDTHGLKNLQQQLQDAGIESSVTGEHIQVRWNPKETETVQLILNTWRHRAHSMPQDGFCSAGPDQYSQKGSVQKRSKTVDRSRLEAGSNWTDQFHQRGSDDKRNIKDGKSRVETGSSVPDQFHQKGIVDKRNIKYGRQEPQTVDKVYRPGEARVDTGVSNKPDRNNGTDQETDFEEGYIENHFDEHLSFYIDANIADILFSEMASEITAIEESGVKLHHDKGVITITCRYLLAELDSVKHRLEALATSVHTKGFYHDCSSRYRCIQSDSVKEIINQAKTKVWFENVKPSQVISRYLAKGISVNVYHGSVIGVLSDVIVCPVVQETGQCFPSGPTAHQLYQYGGDHFRNNIQSSISQPWGTQFSSYKVPRTSYRRICLLVVADWFITSTHNEEKIVDRLYHILEDADREGNARSLAIPLELGCRIPPLQVLDFIMKAINTYLTQQPQYRHLWEVSLVVIDSRYLQQVRRVLDNWKHKESVQQPQEEPLYGEVSLIQGFLFDQMVDAIVVTVHKTLDQSISDLAKEHRRIEGKALEEQCKDLTPKGINPAEAVAVTTGDLNTCKHFILGYLLKNFNKKLYLKLLLENIFKAAKTQQVKSLAVPVIGSGVLDYPPHMCVTEILRSCFIHAQEFGIQTVKLVVGDQELYQEFDGYLWKYQENMDRINESQKHSEEVISADCYDLKVTISDTDHFGSFADMVIFHLDGSIRRDDTLVNGLRIECLHLHRHPWICEKVHITDEKYEGQYKEAFKIANNKTVQLVSLIWKGVENEGQAILQKILSIVELMKRELTQHFLKVKLHVRVSKEVKHSIMDVIRSERTSRLSSFLSYIPSFRDKISWKIEARPGKQFLAINGINLVAVSRDSELLETNTKILAQSLQDIDLQYCEKYEPQVPLRPEQKDQMSGSFTEGMYRSSSEDPKNAQSDTSNNRKPIVEEQGHRKDQVSGSFMEGRYRSISEDPRNAQSDMSNNRKPIVEEHRKDQVSGSFMEGRYRLLSEDPSKAQSDTSNNRKPLAKEKGHRKVSGSFTEGRYRSSPEDPRNAQSDTSKNRKPIAKEQGHRKETKHNRGNGTDTSKLDQYFTVQKSETDTEQQSLVYVDAATRKQTHHDAGVSISEQEDDIFEGQHREDISFCFIEPGIFDVRGIEVKVYSGDILKLDVACIVNAANEKLEHGGGVARVISKAAGKHFQQESHAFIKRHGRLKVSECVHTSGCGLKYEYVLHAVGPRWRSAREETRTRKELRDTIINSLRCVEQLNLPSVGIPSISAGNYQYFWCAKKVCAEEYGKGIVEFIKIYSPKVLKEVHFVDVAPDLVRTICNTFKRFSPDKSSAAKNSAEKHTLKFINNECKPQSPSDIESRQEQTSSNAAIHSFPTGSKKSMSRSCSCHLKSHDGACPSKSPMDSYNSLPSAVHKEASMRSSNRHTGGTENMQQSPTDKGSEPGSRICNYPGQIASSRLTGGAGAMQQSPTFNESRPGPLEWNNPGHTASRGHTGGAGAMQQSPTFNKSCTQHTFGKKPMKTGSKNCMSMSSYDGNEKHATDNDRSLLSRSRTDTSPISLTPSMDSRADCRKEVKEKRTITTEGTNRKTINDEASQMNIAETLGTRKSPYEFDLDHQNEGSVKVLVYKHDITLCTVDAIVSVWTPPDREQGKLAAAIKRQIVPCPVLLINYLENNIRDVPKDPKDRKTNFKSVIYANTPTFKKEYQFNRELRRCIHNIFVTATNDRHRIRSIALPVLGLGPGSTLETCCEILVEETFKACNVSKQNLGSLCKIHLIGFDEITVNVLKEHVEQKLKCLAKKDKECSGWSKAVKKGSHK